MQWIFFYIKQQFKIISKIEIMHGTEKIKKNNPISFIKENKTSFFIHSNQVKTNNEMLYYFFFNFKELKIL